MVLKSRIDITRYPKEEYQWPHENDLCLAFLGKKITLNDAYRPNAFIKVANYGSDPTTAM